MARHNTNSVKIATDYTAALERLAKDATAHKAANPMPQASPDDLHQPKQPITNERR